MTSRKKAMNINIVSYTAICLLGVYLSAYQNCLNSISQYYSIGDVASGFIISMHFTGYLVAPIGMGEVSDRIGKKPVVIIAFFMFITGLLCVYASTGVMPVLIGMFLIGGGFGVIEGTLSGVLSDENPGDANRVLNISQLFFSVGAVSGPLFALLLIELSGSWKSIYIVMAALFCILLVFVSKLGFGVKGDSVRSDNGLITVDMLKEKVFLMLCASMLIYVGIEEGIAFWVNSYIDNVNTAGQYGAYTLSGFWGSMIIGRYVTSRISRNHNRLIITGLFVSMVFLIAALFSKDSLVNLVCFIGIGFGFSAVWPVLMAMTADRYPSYTGTSFGIMMTAAAVGGITVPFLMGLVADISSISMSLALITVLIASVVVIQAKIAYKGKEIKQYNAGMEKGHGR